MADWRLWSLIMRLPNFRNWNRSRLGKRGNLHYFRRGQPRIHRIECSYVSSDQRTALCCCDSLPGYINWNGYFDRLPNNDFLVNGHFDGNLDVLGYFNHFVYRDRNILWDLKLRSRCRKYSWYHCVFRCKSSHKVWRVRSNMITDSFWFRR